MKKITIAIDGYSSCGKSTMAKDLAHEIGYIYVDTGAMYRSVTLFAMRNGLLNSDGSIKTDELKDRMDDIDISFRLNSATGRPDTYLNGELVEKEIRTMEVSANVSRIATLPFVREALVAQQQAMGKKKGIIMDGRDIGTVVLPGADLKIFLTASAEKRAERRYRELLDKGETVCLEQVLADMIERDRNDSSRSAAPLRKAEDAVEVDTSELTLEESIDMVCGLISERMGDERRE